MVTTPPLLAFPVNGGVDLSVPEALAAQAFCLRPAISSDLPFLRDLYAGTRERELAQTGWPVAARRAFVDSQFALQHQHYVHHYPQADFLVLEQRGRAVGRYYLDRWVQPPGEDATGPSGYFLLVDITISPALRGRGIGTALIRHSQLQASAAGVGMQLHVYHHNPDARRLYQRLGFVIVADEGPCQRMHWPDDSA
ncbi:GNAT family N-acetyltransferase [Lysobacter fragariae]